MLSLLVGAVFLSQGYSSAFVARAPSILSTPAAAARHPLSAASASALGRRAIVMKDGDEPKKNGPALDVSRVVSVIVTLGILGSIVFNAVVPPPPLVPVITYSALIKEIKAKEVSEVFFLPTDREVVVRTKADLAQRVAIFPTAQPELVSLLESNDVPFAVAPAQTQNFLGQAFGVLLNLAFPLFLLAQLVGFRPGGGAGGGAGGGGMGGPLGMMQQLGKSKSTVQLEPNTGVTFADVAGCDGSKLELREVVDFLKTPGKFAAVGARAPRGVLLEGPPGTGKTLLARAVAGEAGVGFISASGSEFVEMFVGVGASRIRDLFKQAKDNSPCIIFIDEIDAIGKSRGGGGTSGGGNDEREQTLNQILTEMDGFEKAAGVVVIAATNRADVLDAALLRPGRFDRRVPVELPDRDGRRAILGVHARDKPLGADVDLELVAARTTGFSGASLANLLNEAAIVTARRDKTELGMPEIEYALDRLTVGLEKRTGMTSDARKRLVAYHEAGHAILGALTPNFDAVGKITIVPRSGGAGGFTLFVPSDERQDSGLYSRKYLEAQLQVALGGRVAEELAYGAEEVTTGASSDLQRVADVARRMVTQWGFATEALGSTAWESPMGSGFNSPKMASEATQERIDMAVEAIVRNAYESCKKTLTDNRALLDRLTDLLVERETVGNDELMQLVREFAAAPNKADSH